MTDPFQLERFVKAQLAQYANAIAELRAGRKQSHWMWFVFPQLKGLGHSEAATFYGIGSRAEALAYTEHALLGPRLRECTEALLALAGTSAHAIFGSPDDLKFRSSMTLFAQAAADGAPFQRAIEAFFEGIPDPKTVQLLED